MVLYNVFVSDGECMNLLVVCESEQIAKEVIEWLKEHPDRFDRGTYSIEEVVVLRQTKNMEYRYIPVYEVTIHADCSIEEKRIYHRCIIYPLDMNVYIRHWNGTGYGESLLSFEDAWNSVVKEWDRMKKLFFDKFPTIDRIIINPFIEGGK